MKWSEHDSNVYFLDCHGHALLYTIAPESPTSTSAYDRWLVAAVAMTSVQPWATLSDRGEQEESCTWLLTFSSPVTKKEQAAIPDQPSSPSLVAFNMPKQENKNTTNQGRVLFWGLQETWKSELLSFWNMTSVFLFFLQSLAYCLVPSLLMHHTLYFTVQGD